MQIHLVCSSTNQIAKPTKIHRNWLSAEDSAFSYNCDLEWKSPSFKLLSNCTAKRCLSSDKVWDKPVHKCLKASQSHSFNMKSPQQSSLPFTQSWENKLGMRVISNKFQKHIKFHQNWQRTLSDNWYFRFHFSTPLQPWMKVKVNLTGIKMGHSLKLCTEFMPMLWHSLAFINLQLSYWKDYLSLYWPLICLHKHCVYMGKKAIKKQETQCSNNPYLPYRASLKSSPSQNQPSWTFELLHANEWLRRL